MHTPNKLKYILYALRKNPLEILRLFQIAFTTFVFRYIRQCVGKGTTVEPGTKIINAGNVHIGRDCLLKEGNYIRSGGAKGAQGTIIIKDRAALNAFCKIFGHGSVTIGEDTQLGPGTLVTTTSHDYSDDGDLKTFYVPVEIGNRVWIGANVTILPGVKIGDHAVIGAGSVVTRDIPPRSVAVGVPARVIKSIDDSMQKILPNQSDNHRAEMKAPVTEGK